MEQKYVLGIVALSIVAVLGVSMVSAFGFGNGFMNSDLTDEEKQVIQEQKEVMKTIIESGDYSAWETLMLEKVEKMKSQITEENFQKLQERHAERSEFRATVEELKASGDFSREDIQNLRQEYGIEGKGFKNPGKGMKKLGECPFANQE